MQYILLWESQLDYYQYALECPTLKEKSEKLSQASTLEFLCSEVRS